MPCTTLSVHATRLARLQCAADALRRTARFVVVARRLENQMSELERSLVDTPYSSSGKGEKSRRAIESPLVPSNTRISEDILNLGSETEKERAIAKAALSVAELGTISALYRPSCHATFYSCLSNLLASLLDAPAPSSSREVDTSINGEDQYPEEIPLRAINAVTMHIPFIESAREKISLEMESMVLLGLASLVSAILVAHPCFLIGQIYRMF